MPYSPGRTAFHKGTLRRKSGYKRRALEAIFNSCVAQSGRGLTFANKIVGSIPVTTNVFCKASPFSNFPPVCASITGFKSKCPRTVHSETLWDAHLIEDARAGDVICVECGLVVGERLVDVGTEWRSFSDERSGNDPSRVGAAENTLLGAADLSTSIATSFGSSDQDQQLANAQRRSNNQADRKMAAGMGIIREISDRIHLTRGIQDRASAFLRQSIDGNILRGKVVEAQVASCLYIACRQEAVPRTVKEITAAAGCSSRQITKCIKLLIRSSENSFQTITSDDFMSRFCSNLDLPHSVQMAATHIARAAKELDLVAGRSPISIAAASIYLAALASSTKKTAKVIGEMTGAAEVTVKATYRLLRPEAHRLFPDNFNFHTSIADLPSS